MSTTITEALAEIKTLNKRLDTKRSSIASYLARDSRLKDPLEKDGGSAQFIASTRQSIGDLENRLVRIRTAIQRSNLETTATVQGTTRTVAEWLTWRREVSEGSRNFLAQLNNGIQQIRLKAQKDGLAVKEVGSETSGKDVIVNVDEKQLLSEQEAIEMVLGDLDGKLSLLNATTVIEF